MNDEMLVYLDSQGLIPGPEESIEQYKKRAGFCLNLKNNHEEHYFPFDQNERGNEIILVGPHEMTEKLFGITPNWIPLFFSNKSLKPWQGGCAWIFQLKESSMTSAFLQLRKIFRYSSNFLKFYHRDELMAHEISHVGRMMFNEKKFEEILAYRTSSSIFQRYLGPILQSEYESLLFVFILLFIISSDFLLIFFDYEVFYQQLMWMKLIPIILLGLGLIRLGWNYFIFEKCLNRLKVVLEKSTLANAVIYRLKDAEIKAFSQMKPIDIIKFIQEQNNANFRWSFLNKIYFKNLFNSP